MFRRLGQSAYRADSPSLREGRDTESLSIASDATLPSIDYSLDDTTSCVTLKMTESDVSSHERVTETRDADKAREQRIVEKHEVAVIEANICRKLDTIVCLTADFASDAIRLRENADELLVELRTKVLPYLINLDTDMRMAEALIRYNIDRSNVNETRIDWLLEYNKYQLELRRVLDELAGEVYSDLEESLELRYRGVIARRPCSLTMENLNEMKSGMQRAVQLLCPAQRAVA